MILGDKEIEAARDAGDLVIEPFDRRNLGSDTYDVCLGPFHFREQRPAWRPQPIFNPFLRESVLGVWGEAENAEDVILLNPGETILAHTIEFIGGVRGITTKIDQGTALLALHRPNLIDIRTLQTDLEIAASSGDLTDEW
jgi:dCTP deaminase